MVTSDPVRDRIVALTRSISGATSPSRLPMEAEEGLAKGTMTAKEGTPDEGRPRIETLSFASRQVRHSVKRDVGLRRRWFDVRGRPMPVRRGRQMGARLRELIRTNDMVLVSAVEALLN